MEDGGAIVLGIGNPHRGDDAAGPMAARLLRGRLPAGVEAHAQDGEPASLLACLEGMQAAWLIDACASDGRGGAILRFDAAASPLPAAGLAFSSHGLGLPEAVELARALGQLPERCVVFAIEGACFEPGAALSAPVEAAVREVAQRVQAEVAEAFEEGVAGDA